MTQVRIWQAICLVCIAAGIAVAAGGAGAIGGVMIVVGLVFFFAFVALVGWSKAGRR